MNSCLQDNDMTSHLKKTRRRTVERDKGWMERYKTADDYAKDGGPGEV